MNEGDDPALIDDDGDYDDHSGQDIDIWGDGSATRSTPIPEAWDEQIR